ncbi:hypothetical protein EV421DRAFT_1910970 [Armillaria borealis]|uniref:Uncharacterized protein n=1 Tax=Armillaria borealis TaxID=47425 RepID=A0AA39IXU5_9AGAR|nr:hypothetical protein EV421DRAFT_1910970 [Armillaria borealis]
MFSNDEFLVEALKDIELTAEEWQAISEACDECIKASELGESPEPQRGPATIAFILNSPTLRKDKRVTQKLKTYLLNSYTANQPTTMKNRGSAVKSYFRRTVS